MNYLTLLLLSVIYVHQLLLPSSTLHSSNLIDPEIAISQNTFSGLSYYLDDGPSHSVSFTISSSNLQDNLTITPTTGFEISTDNSTFQNIPITLPQTTTESTIYTRLKHNQAIDSYGGNIEIASIGVNTKTVSLAGEVWTKTEWSFIENFNNSMLTSGYKSGSFIGNGNITWQYTNCRDERGKSDVTHFMVYTKGIKLRNSESKIYTTQAPNGIKNFACKLFRGSSSSTQVEVDFYVNGALIATSEGFNDDEMHEFLVEDISIFGNCTIEIRNQKSISAVIDDISWTNYNDPDTRFIKASHETISNIIGTTDNSFSRDEVITINASNLIDDLIINATPNSFLVSKDNLTFDTTLTINMGSGDIQNTNIYIRLDPSSSKRKYTGNITLTSTGASSKQIMCIGATRPQTSTPLFINEVDADTKDFTGATGNDEYDFIELYTGEPGVKDLTGYVLVFYNGSTSEIYRNYPLTNKKCNEEGYFVMGNTAVRDAIINFDSRNHLTTDTFTVVENNYILQNGPDAVALYYGEGGDFTNLDSITLLNLVDAMVYSLSDDKNQYPLGLMSLLNDGQPYVNEDSYDVTIDNITYNKQTNSMGRIGNGEGGLRNTNSYVPCTPTPGMANKALLNDGVPTKISKKENSLIIKSFSNTLSISGKYTGEVLIYDIKGSLIKILFKSNSTISTPINTGVYIIQVAKNPNIKPQKIIVTMY